MMLTDLISIKACRHSSDGPHLDLILRKEEGCLASGPVLYKCAVGHHLVMDSGECNGSQEVVTQLYQPACSSSQPEEHITSNKSAQLHPVTGDCLAKCKQTLFAAIPSISAVTAGQKMPAGCQDER